MGRGKERRRVFIAVLLFINLNNMVTLTRETKGKEVIEQEKERTDSSNNTKKTLGKGTRGLCVLSSWTSAESFLGPTYVEATTMRQTNSKQ